MKTATIYVHSSKESNWDLGEKLGLSEEAIRLFRFTACEVKLDLEVEDTGESKIVAVDGQALVDAAELARLRELEAAVLEWDDELDDALDGVDVPERMAAAVESCRAAAEAST